MPRSRTIITLCSLLAAMTAGTFILMALETSPAGPAAGLSLIARRPSPTGLAATDVERIWQTNLPIRPNRWRCIVLHDSVCDLSGDGPAGCHFVIHGGGAIEMTPRWRQQADGNHIHVPGADLNAESIGICLMGNLAVQPPTSVQTATLTGLVHVLQQRFDIPADRVWLHGDLTGQPCPGDRFAAAPFRRLLLTRRR